MNQSSNSKNFIAESGQYLPQLVLTSPHGWVIYARVMQCEANPVETVVEGALNQCGVDSFQQRLLQFWVLAVLK